MEGFFYCLYFYFKEDLKQSADTKGEENIGIVGNFKMEMEHFKSMDRSSAGH